MGILKTMTIKNGVCGTVCVSWNDNFNDMKDDIIDCLYDIQIAHKCVNLPPEFEAILHDLSVAVDMTIQNFDDDSIYKSSSFRKEVISILCAVQKEQIYVRVANNQFIKNIVEQSKFITAIIYKNVVGVFLVNHRPDIVDLLEDSLCLIDVDSGISNLFIKDWNERTIMPVKSMLISISSCNEQFDFNSLISVHISIMEMCEALEREYNKHPFVEYVKIRSNELLGYIFKFVNEQ